MSNEIQYRDRLGRTSLNLYAQRTTTTSTIWNGTAHVTYAVPDWATYAITLNDAGGGLYRADMPAAAAGIYALTAFERAGADPAETDGVVGGPTDMTWNGTIVVSSLLDLTQPLADVKTATVGGALHGGWSAAWGKIIKNAAAKTLSVFGIGSQSVPLIVFDLDNAQDPKVRTPR